MSQPTQSWQKLSSALFTAFENGNFTDCIVECGSKSWKCHKLILCSRCPYFKAAFEGNFKEAETSTIKFEEESADDVYQVIRFLYKEDYQLSESAHSTYSNEMSHHASIYALGERLSIQPLKSKALKKFAILLSDQKDAAERFAFIQSDVIPKIYSTTPTSDRGLRNTVCCWIRTNRLNKLVDSIAFAKFMTQVDGLAMDLLRSSLVSSEGYDFLQAPKVTDANPYE